MRLLTKTDWEVLNATADDWESLEQVYLMLRQDEATGPPQSLCDIADSVARLVNDGLLEARSEDGAVVTVPAVDLQFVWRSWFRMTPQGREAWAEE